MDVQSRRALLTCDSNPNNGSDYLISLGGSLMMENHGTFDIRVTYVPESFILDIASFHGYLMALGDSPEMTPERSGKTLLEDANNELVPRWIRVTLIGRRAAATTVSYRCLFQDSQPNWSNPSLTAAVIEFEAA